MKTWIFIISLFILQTSFSQGIRMSKMIDGKMYTVTPSTKVYDSTGALVPFEKWFSMIEQYDLKPNSVKDGEEQTFTLVRYPEEVIMKRKEEIEKRRKEMNANPVVVGNKIKPFQFTDIQGKLLRSSDLIDKVIVFNYWFVDCAPCVREIPELNALQQKFANRTDVVFIAVSPIDDKEKISKFLHDKPFTFMHIAKDEAKQMEETKSIGAFPSYLVVDKKGKITLFNQGYSTNTISSLTNHIETLLQ